MRYFRPKISLFPLVGYLVQQSLPKHYASAYMENWKLTVNCNNNNDSIINTLPSLLKNIFLIISWHHFSPLSYQTNPCKNFRKLTQYPVHLAKWKHFLSDPIQCQSGQIHREHGDINSPIGWSDATSKIIRSLFDKCERREWWIQSASSFLRLVNESIREAV